MSQVAKGSRPQARQPALVALHLVCPSKSGEWLFHNSLTWLILNYEHNYTLQKVNRSYKSVVADSSLCAAQSARVGKGDARPGEESSTPDSRPRLVLLLRAWEPPPRDRLRGQGAAEGCRRCDFLLQKGEREMERRKLRDFSIRAALNSSLLASCGKPPIGSVWALICFWPDGFSCPQGAGRHPLRRTKEMSV